MSVLGVRRPGGVDNEVMGESLSYGGYGTAARDRTRTLFGQTMWYVAVTAGFFALGSYLGRNLSQGWVIVWFIIALASLISMNFTVRRSAGLTVALLLVVGVALGLAMAPVLVYYASTNPQVLWQAGGATALFIAGVGAAGGLAAVMRRAVPGAVGAWGAQSPREKIRRKNRNTFSASRKIDAARSGAESKSVDRRSR